MPSTYTTNLGIEKIATGEQSGTWGTTTNTNFDLIDTAVNGIVSVTLASAGTSGSPNDLPITDGTASNGRNKFIEFVDGGDLGATAYVQLTPNDAEKIVHIRNSLSGSRSIIVFQGTYNASNDFEIPNGADVTLKFNGGGTGATVTDVNVDLTVTGATIATADINGGTIDGTVIGGSSAAAGTFTTFTSTGIDDNATSTAITIDASENVGIGTASPSSTAGWGTLLEVSGTINAGIKLTETDTANGDYSIGVTAGTLRVWDETTSSWRMTIDGSGNVGIGTTSPSTSLDVVRAGAQPLRVQSTSGTECQINMVNTGGNVQLEAHSGNFTIDADNVGIGTTSPDGKLNVFSASAGSVSADADADELVLENSGNVGLSLLTASTGESGIYFGNPGTNGQKDFYLKYYHESHATTANRRAFTFNTASTERMRIDSSGNVGIGTTSPESTLTVKPQSTSVGTNENQCWLYDSSSSGNEFDLKLKQVVSSNLVKYTFDLRNAGASYNNNLVLDRGNVGIGTTSPGYKLQLNSVSDNDGLLIKSGSASYINYLLFGDSGSNTVGRLGYNHANNSMTFFTGDSERMRIDSNGNAGIGTSSINASYRLNVEGAIIPILAKSSSTAASDTYACVAVARPLNTVGTGSGYGMNMNNSSGAMTEYGYIGAIIENNTASSQNGALVFVPTSSGTRTERMRINSSGNVGIGTTSPGYPLTIGGNSDSANNVLTGSGIVVGTTIGLRERGNTAGVGGNVYASQIYQGNSGGGDLEIYNVSSTYSLVFGTNTTERMRIDSAGSVIIKPSGKLYLESSAGFSPYLVEASNALTVNTNGSERMRINSSGDVIISGTAKLASSLLTVDGNGEVTNGVCARVNNNAYWNYVGINSAGNNSFYVYGDGDVENTNNSYGAISDERVKSNIVDASSQIDDIMAVQVRSYTLNETGATHIGVVAQELEASGMSGLVKTKDDGMKSVKYSILYMKAIKALQEAVTRIETLEAEVAALKGA